MIQRIQTLYLVLGLGLLMLLFYLPLFEAKTTNSDKTNIVELNCFKVVHYITGDQQPYPYQVEIFPFSMNIIVIVMGLVTIFMFKNRRQQLLICRFLILLVTALIVALFYAADKANELLIGLAHTSSYPYYLVIIIPVLSMACFFMASKGIIKDELKVRSTDRLR